MTNIEASLSPAERDVLQKLLNGLRNQEIASRLRLSDKTVKNHISHILRKTGTTSRLELTKNTTRFGVSCDGSRCVGSLKLNWVHVEQVRDGKRFVTRTVQELLASQRFSLVAGWSGPIVLRLNSRNSHFLAEVKLHPVRVGFQVTVVGGMTARGNVVVR